MSVRINSSLMVSRWDVFDSDCCFSSVNFLPFVLYQSVSLDHDYHS